MSVSMTNEIRAEPNLTPLLDVVFQLITFFMLVINFSSENYDARVRLPVAGSARPVEEGDQAAVEDRLVLNVDRQGHMLMTGRVLTSTQAIQEIKHQADLVKLNARAAGIKPDPSGDLPTTIILRADRDTPFSSIFTLITACQANGFRKFALKAMTGS
jgi:biopolymer transport protein ExbD